MHGLYLTTSILQKTWSDVWRITTQRSGSGEAGIEVIIFGLSGALLLLFFIVYIISLMYRYFVSGTFIFRWAAQKTICLTLLWCFHSSPFGMT